MSLSITIPIRIESEANLREHHMAKARRVKKQREAVAWAFKTVSCEDKLNAIAPLMVQPLSITLTRIAPRVLDSDNCQRGFKAVRDQIAQELGINDGDEKAATWEYRQRKGKAKEYAVQISIE